MKNKSIAQLTALLLASTLAVSANAADSYTVDSTHTYPAFEINHMGFSTQRGRFDKTTGKIVLDAAAKKGMIEINIDVNSLNMGLEKWNDHLKSPDFFDAAKFSTMKFTSTKLTFDKEKLVAAEGEFTLLGVTKPLTIKVSNFACGKHPMVPKVFCGAEISATIKRSDFGMMKYLPLVGDEVKIFAPIEAGKD
jgi:polyisoprenoid-binding protein YceI